MLQKTLLFFIITAVYSVMNGQQCSYSLKGKIILQDENEVLENCSVCIEDDQQCCISNQNGEFCLKNLCKGTYHIKISHLGCKPYSQHIEIKKDTIIEVALKHDALQLNETIVHAGEIQSKQTNVSLDNELIAKKANKNFGDLLSDVTGVSALKTGTISKPIVHGLSGSRVGYIVNGVELTSQQWGNDHAPEIDPFAADHLTVIKGVASLEYATSASNAIVLVEPYEIKKQPHIHGQLNHIFETNGRGQTSNFRISNYNKIVGFNVTHTYKMFGDLRTPNYFLTNTGTQQSNTSIQLEKDITKKLTLNTTLSYYNLKLGILSGSIANTPDQLTEASEEEEPYRTNDYFSYYFEQPKQEVKHYNVTSKLNYKLSNLSSLHFTYAFQNNFRQEFDRRRAGNSDIPVLDIDKKTHFYELKYKHKFSDALLFKSGLQSTQITNKNISGTFVTPILPAHNADNFGGFVYLIKESNNWDYEFGARLFGDLFNVADTSSMEEVERYEYDYFNYAFSGSVSKKINSKLNINLSSGYSTRSPQVNELFSFGLHQGIGRIERGSITESDTFLNQEKNFKTTLSIDFKLSSKFAINLLGYYNPIKDYIYTLNMGLASTVRGVFYEDHYVQNDVLIMGSDFSMTYKPLHELSFLINLSYLYGQDITNDQPLIYMSPNNGSLKANYAFKNFSLFSSNSIYALVSHTMKQDRFILEQEIIDTPDAYTLLNLGLETSLKLWRKNVDFNLTVENVFDISYRNYLNRFRYYADEPGRNISFRLAYKF